jgi:5-methylcytosine-specific restriction protein A
MPYRPPINCDYGTCRLAALPKSRYCQQHQKVAAPQVAQQEQARNRNEPWRKWYHRAHWRRLRGLVLARDPICTICNRAASNVADHKRPHKGDWALFCDMNNLQGVCKPCHDLKTATEDGGFGSAPKDADAPVRTGESGKQFSSSAVGEAAIDRALAEEL